MDSEYLRDPFLYIGGISNDCEGYINLSPEDPLPDVHIGFGGGLTYNKSDDLLRSEAQSG